MCLGLLVVNVLKDIEMLGKQAGDECEEDGAGKRLYSVLVKEREE